MRRRRRQQITAGLLTAIVLVGCTETRQFAQLRPWQPTAPVMQLTELLPSELWPVAAPPQVPLPREKPEERPASAWRTNAEALEIIQEAEGLRLNSYYLAGQWLIGYGHATLEPEEIASTMTITEWQAKQLLKADIAICEDAVRREIGVRVTQNEFSAMVALCYNVGIGTFGNSSIVKHMNAGEKELAADAFLLYNHARIEEKKRQLTHLTQRRIKERFLFLASS